MRIVTTLLIGGACATLHAQTDSTPKGAFVAKRADSALTQTTVGRPRLSTNPKKRAEQLRRVPDFVEAHDLDEKTSWLARGHYTGMTVLTSGDEQTSYIVVRRTT